MNLMQLAGSCELGLIYALVAIGVYLSFRVIDFPDLTVDGTFPLGAAVAAILILNGCNPLLASGLAVLAGALAGLVTGFLNVRWQILGLLAGILTLTALYSINLRVMGNRPNLAIMDEITVFHFGPVLVLLLTAVVLVVLALHFFFASHFGLALRAGAINPKAGAAYGINVNVVKLTVLAISNSLVALAGALFAQSQGFADISMGTGTIIVGLASVIMGEAFFHPRSVTLALLACVVGSVVYRFVISLALNSGEIGLKATDLNLITAVIVAGTMVLTKMRRGVRNDRT